jgi:hypothetical protein
MPTEPAAAARRPARLTNKKAVGVERTHGWRFPAKPERSTGHAQLRAREALQTPSDCDRLSVIGFPSYQDFVAL